MPDLDQTLQERGNRYGTFMGHAQITQNLKELFRGSLGVSKEVRDTVRFRWDVMNADQREALDMLAHKVGRILNGDPHYADSWVDIAGYTKLVADRLLADEQKGAES